MDACTPNWYDLVKIIVVLTAHGYP